MIEMIRVVGGWVDSDIPLYVCLLNILPMFVVQVVRLKFVRPCSKENDQAGEPQI